MEFHGEFLFVGMAIGYGAQTSIWAVSLLAVAKRVLLPARSLINICQPPLLSMATMNLVGVSH